MIQIDTYAFTKHYYLEYKNTTDETKLMPLFGVSLMSPNFAIPKGCCIKAINGHTIMDFFVGHINGGQFFEVNFDRMFPIHQMSTEELKKIELIFEYRDEDGSTQQKITTADNIEAPYFYFSKRYAIAIKLPAHTTITISPTVTIHTPPDYLDMMTFLYGKSE